MADKFLKYRSFNDKAIATELCRRLAEHDIPFAWESTEGFFDATFANNDILNIFYVKLRPEDFSRADALVIQSIAEEEPTGDYYLLSFSNDELIDVMKNPFEWNEFDQYWAKKILRTRGIEVRAEELHQAREKRLQELKKPWIADKLWLLIAFMACVCALWLVHIFSAIGVLFIGGYISFSKKTMPDGERVKAFSTTDRLLGKIVLAAGIVLTVYIVLQYYGFVEFMHPL